MPAGVSRSFGPPAPPPSAHVLQEQSPVELDLRAYLDILKRHRWIIIEAAVVVAVVAAVLTALKTPTYTATAKVLLRPNDQAETTNPNTITRSNVDPDRNVSAQLSIVNSEAV